MATDEIRMYPVICDGPDGKPVIGWGTLALVDALRAKSGDKPIGDEMVYRSLVEAR